jgi:hypothetical protein
LHLPQRKIAQRGTDLRQNLVLIVNERHADVAFGEIPIKACAVPDQIVYFARQLDPAKPTADDYERKMELTSLRIAARLRLLELVDDMRAQSHRVSHRLERERVVAHPWNNAEITFGSAGNHEMVVVRALQLALVVLKFDLTSREIDAFDGFGAALYSGQHLSNCCGCGIRVDRCSSDISQERVEHHVILPAVDNDLALLARQSRPQSPRALDRCEAATNNYNFRARHFELSAATAVWKVSTTPYLP